MKKLTCTLFLFAVIVSSLFAYTKPGGLPTVVSIENLTTKENVSYNMSELIYNSVNQWPLQGIFETPTITFSKGICAEDKIQISMLDPDYAVCIYGWTISYTSQAEAILEDGGNSGCASETIIHLIPNDLTSDNVDMDICSYLSIPVSTGASIANDITNTGLYKDATYQYHFKFSGIRNESRYKLKKEPGGYIIIVGPPVIVDPHSSAQKRASIATLYNSFGKTVKMVSLNSDSTRIYVGDLNSGIYILKFTIDGIEYTEKINL